MSSRSIEDLRSALSRGDYRGATALAIGIMSEKTRKPERGEEDAKARFASIAGHQQELFAVVALRNGSVVYDEVITKGLLNRTLVHPRELYSGALTAGADTVLVSHNHPSGNSEPSREDLEATQRMKEAAKILGLHFKDHYIVVKNENGVDLFSIEDNIHHRGVLDYTSALRELEKTGQLSQGEATSVMEALKKAGTGVGRETISRPEQAVSYLAKNANLGARTSDHVLLMDASGAPMVSRDIPSSLSVEDKLRYVATAAIQARAASVIYFPAKQYDNERATAEIYTGKDFTGGMKTIGIECQDVVPYQVNAKSVEFYSSRGDSTHWVELDQVRQQETAPSQKQDTQSDRGNLHRWEGTLQEKPSIRTNKEGQVATLRLEITTPHGAYDEQLKGVRVPEELVPQLSQLSKGDRVLVEGTSMVPQTQVSLPPADLVLTAVSRTQEKVIDPQREVGVHGQLGLGL